MGGILGAVVAVLVVIIVVVVIAAATVRQRKRRRFMFIKGKQTRLYGYICESDANVAKGYYQLKLKWHIRINGGWISPTRTRKHEEH